MKIYIILLGFLFNIAYGQEHFDILNFSELNLKENLISKKEFSIDRKINDPHYISNAPYLYNAIVTLDDTLLKEINIKFFKTKFLLTNKSKFLVFNYKEKKQELYFASFIFNKRLYYFGINENNIFSINYNQDDYINILNEYSKIKYSSCLKNISLGCLSRVSFSNVFFNKETELMANGYSKYHYKTKTELLTDMIYSSKEKDRREKWERYVNNFNPSYSLDLIDTYTEDLTIDEWENKLRESHSLIKNTEGKKIKIALIDSGFKREKDFLQVQNNEPKNSHGTHVGGIILALNSNIDLISYNVFNEEDSLVSSKIAEAINSAIENKVNLINLSIEGTGFDYAEFKALKKADANGIIIVVAAGNKGVKLDKNSCEVYPACYKKDIENMIVVGNLNNMGDIHYSSNYGELVDIFFHGEGIQSLSSGKGFVTMTGTSQSTPFITGILSQFLSKQDVSINEIKEFLTLNSSKEHSRFKNTDMLCWKTNSSIREIAKLCN